MADSNEALPQPAAPSAPAAAHRGRRKKVKPVRPVCRTKGRFSHCPGTPVPHRAHRRVCRVGEPKTCPPGSERVENGGKGISCLSVPPPGSKRPAHFVDVICASRKSGERLVRGKEPPPSIFSPAVVKEAAVEAKKTKARGPKVLDWSKCDCAPGLLERRLPSGAVRCQDPVTKKFQKATCRDGAYSKPGRKSP